MKTPKTELWTRLEAYEFDVSDASMPFSARLARDHLWTTSYALEVIEEYRKFMYLCATSSNIVTPSEDVDLAWHLHMVYTRSYWDDFCGKVLQKKIHHGPTPGSEKILDYVSAYKRTLDLYEKEFGRVVNKDIWPGYKKRFGYKKGASYVTISTKDVYFAPKNARRYMLPLFVFGCVFVYLTSTSEPVSKQSWIVFASMSAAFFTALYYLLPFTSSGKTPSSSKYRSFVAASATAGSGGGCSAGAVAVAAASAGDGGGGCSGGGGCGGGCG